MKTRDRRTKWYETEDKIITADESGFEIEEDEFDFKSISNEHKRELLMYLGFSEEESYAINVYDRVILNGYLDAIALTYNSETFELSRKLELIQVLKVEGFSDNMLDEYSVEKRLNKKNEVVSRLEGTILVPFRRVVYCVYIMLFSLLGLAIMCFEFKQLKWSIVLAIITLLNVWMFIDEFKKYRKSKNTYGILYKNTYRFRIANILFTFGVIVMVALVFIGEVILREIRAPKGYVFYDMNSWFDFIIFMSSLIYIPKLISYIICKINAKEERITWFNRIKSYDSFSNRHIGKFTCLYLIIFLMCSMSGVYVTEQEIVCYSPMNLMGKHYSFDKINSVKAGFGNKHFAFKEGRSKGEFYYDVNIGNKVFRFSDIGIMENSDSDLYSMEAIDMVDKAIMSYGVKKDSSSKFNELMEYKEDRKICLDIINRK